MKIDIESPEFKSMLGRDILRSIEARRLGIYRKARLEWFDMSLVPFTYDASYKLCDAISEYFLDLDEEQAHYYFVPFARAEFAIIGVACMLIADLHYEDIFEFLIAFCREEAMHYDFRL